MGTVKTRKIGNKVFVRIDKGEELMGNLKKACEEHGVRAGLVYGIGATDKAVIGFFDPVEKSYLPMERVGDHEITSLAGNISTIDEKVFPHIHITLADDTFNVVGGHLNSAIISVTCEIVIEVADGKVERAFDQEKGVNLWDL